MASTGFVTDAVVTALVELLDSARRRASPRVRAVAAAVADATTPPIGTTLVTPGADDTFTGIGVFDASRAVRLIGVRHPPAVGSPVRPRAHKRQPAPASSRAAFTAHYPATEFET